jgi:hypothetical protein
MSRIMKLFVAGYEIVVAPAGLLVLVAGGGLMAISLALVAWLIWRKGASNIVRSRIESAQLLKDPTGLPTKQ